LTLLVAFASQFTSAERLMLLLPNMAAAVRQCCPTGFLQQFEQAAGSSQVRRL